MKIQITRITDHNDPVIPQVLEPVDMETGFVNPLFFENENNILLVAEIEDAAAGFLYAYILERIENETPVLFLYSIDVFPDFRRKGVGVRLIEELKEIGRERNACKMFVLTSPDNDPALGLYTKTGGIRKDPDEVLFTYY